MAARVIKYFGTILSYVGTFFSGYSMEDLLGGNKGGEDIITNSTIVSEHKDNFKDFINIIFEDSKNINNNS